MSNDFRGALKIFLQFMVMDIIIIRPPAGLITARCYAERGYATVCPSVRDVQVP